MPFALAPAAAPPVVEVVVPVHNEQRALPASIRRLHDVLTAELPYPWRILIADNASTDETNRVASAYLWVAPRGAGSPPDSSRRRARR